MCGPLLTICAKLLVGMVFSELRLAHISRARTGLAGKNGAAIGGLFSARTVQGLRGDKVRAPYVMVALSLLLPHTVVDVARLWPLIPVRLE